MSRVGNSRLAPRTLGLAAGTAGNFGGGFPNFMVFDPGDPGLGLISGPQGGISFLAGIDAKPSIQGPLGGGLLGTDLSGKLAGGESHAGPGLDGSSTFDCGAGLMGGGFLKGMSFTQLFGAGLNLGG